MRYINLRFTYLLTNKKPHSSLSIVVFGLQSNQKVVCLT